MSRAWAAAATAAALLAYCPTLRHGFVFDDDVVVVRNRLLRSADHLPALVSRTEWAGAGLEVQAWRPLTGVSYALNHAVSGLSPWSYHLSNALLHALAAALVVALAARLGLSATAAGIAGLLFALHPIHVEAVSNVIGRKDVLATTFLLAMLLAWRRALDRGGAALALPVLAYAGAMLSKEVGVVGIGLVVLDTVLHRPRDARSPPSTRRLVVLLALLLATLAGYLLLYRAVTSGVPESPIPFEDNPAAHASTVVRVMTAIAVIGKGLALQFLPVGQSPDWSYASIPLVATPLDLRFVGSLGALGLWSWLGLRFRRTSPVVLFGLGWYVLSLLPASNLLFPVGTIFGERLLYLPSVGLALTLGAGLAALGARIPRRAAAAGGLVLAALLAAATLRYSSAWADETSLFRAAAASAPESTKVHHKLAILALRDGRLDEAEAEIARSLEIHPGYARAHVVHAEVLRRLGRPAEEAAALSRAIEADPRDADALYALGRLARDSGRLDEAAGWWRRAIAVRPRHAPSLGDLAAWHMFRSEAGPAIELLRRAVDADEQLASAWYNLGLLLRARGDEAGARAALERFLATAGDEYAAEAEAVRRTLPRGP